MTDYVLLGLVRRRAELTGEVERLHAHLSGLLKNLETIDAAIIQFDPKHVVESIKPRAFRPPADWSNRGQMTRVVLSMLRQAAEPMTTRDLALEMLISRALDREDQKLLKLMAKRIGVALRTQRDNGVVESQQGPGQFVLWQVVRK